MRSTSDIAVWTLLLQVGATLAMVGLIWFVQIVHYPLFSEVGRDNFPRYERDHQRLTTWVVAPLMLTELATAALLFRIRPDGLGTGALWLGLALLAIIWLTTYLVQVPQHAALAQAFDDQMQRRLVLGNWIRTVAWSVRGVLTLWMVHSVLNVAAANRGP